MDIDRNLRIELQVATREWARWKLGLERKPRLRWPNRCPACGDTMLLSAKAIADLNGPGFEAIVYCENRTKTACPSEIPTGWKFRP
jgi:hypothetical protein